MRPELLPLCDRKAAAKTERKITEDQTAQIKNWLSYRKKKKNLRDTKDATQFCLETSKSPKTSEHQQSR